MNDLKILKISDGRCHFCLSSAGDVERLIAGQSAFICDECVERCRTALGASPVEEKP